MVHDALCLSPGSVRGEKNGPIMLYRGVHSIKQIVFISSSGFVTLDALHWCSQQGISIVLMDKTGHLMYSCTPEPATYAELRRLQYRTCGTDAGVSIAREIVYRKTIAQIVTLKTLAKSKYKQIFKKYRLKRVWSKPEWEILEDSLVEILRMKEIREIRTLEARLAMIYWNAFTGIPIKWQTKDAKIVPPHWKEITERSSPLSSNNTGRRAINPFHAALNYMYAVTEHQLLGAIHLEGLDPACGFLHVDSLVYDLVEPLRSVVDGRVFSFFISTAFKRGDFTLTTDGHVMFNPELLRWLVTSCKLDETISGGIVSWLKDFLLRSGGISS